MIDKNIKLAVLGVLLFGLCIFNFNISDTRLTNENVYDDNTTNQLISSGFWNLTGSPILIDDNDPSKNWSYTASHYDWCSGSGNWTDPYVIENVTINGQGLGSCIEIINSIVYFIIKNCTTYNSGTGTYDAGIYLEKTDNGIIMDNNCSYYNRYGFLLLDTSNNTLSGNIANNNSRSGFMLSGGGNNTLLGNIANNNSQGFMLSGDNNTLTGNMMDLGGIYVFGSINEMTSQNIDNSNLLNTKPIYYYGNEIRLKPNDFLNAGQIILINCNNSLISGMSISKCYNGISLDYSNNITIKDNIISNNINNGIEMKNSFDNTLSRNNVSFNSHIGINFVCSNITLWNNTANNNQDRGIFAHGDNNFFIENEVNNNNLGGIKIEGNNNTILDNYALSINNNYGIYIIGMHNNASRNTMKNCGIGAYGLLSWRSTCFIDTSNKVNEKPVYFYNNEIGLKAYDFTNAGQVQLNNCSNSVISNLNISNISIGIMLYLCNNNTISSNIITNNSLGIFLTGNNNTLSGNIMNNNKEDGIQFYGDNNTLSRNSLSYNKNNGLGFQGNNNQFIENTISYNNMTGIFPMGSNCDFNLYSENNISKNGAIGIILFSGSNDNLFYRNVVDDNGINAEDRGFNNKWDNGIIGNYWGDYTGIDSNNDGIGDSPYSIFGTANSQDNFPLLDIIPPKITINSPVNNDVFGTIAPDFNVEISEPHIDKMWYTINNGTMKFFFTSNGTINQALWDILTEGNVIIRFYANDTFGRIGSQEFTVVKKISPPAIPGYDLLFLFGIISVIAIIIIKKICMSNTHNFIIKSINRGL